ncbi:NAD(P)-dependent oxidoreductase [Virgibacillus siamensis]|uniref:NAD(P)-dependent oxidoreductase n=1 Tax=Virgibacillus siamensis TaxID=480071 RepID=UPI00098623DC|nr:NAD(P)-dependent oxidoreductase [Virgibacillus siamensis]
MNKIGVIGCGLMGSGIVKNLLKNNYEVYIYDVNTKAVDRLVNEGAIASHVPEEFAAKIDCLIFSLPTPELVNQNVTDLIRFLKKGTLILDMSTNDAELTRKLFEQCQDKGIEFFDCPLSGGPDGAENGTLTIMIGGTESALPSVMPILQAVGEQIEYIGESGAGQTVKLCHNMVVGGVIALLSEVFVAGEKAGVEKEKLASILQKGSAQTRAMDVFGVNIVEDNFLNVKFSLANMTKDILLYDNLIANNKVPALASQSANQLYKLASYQGKGQLDSAAVYEVLHELESSVRK